MAYTLGALHTVNASSSIVVADPAGLKIRVRSVPATVSTRLGPPLQYFDLGALALGNVDGYQWRAPLRYAAQLEYPVPRGMTSLAVELAAGAAVDVTELNEPAPVLSEPWQRNPVAVSRSWYGAINPQTPLTTAFTYTIPAGRMLCLAKMTAWMHRWQAPSSQGTPQVMCWIGGIDNVCIAGLTSGVSGATVVDELSGGPIYLPAGGSVGASVFSNDTGGMVYARASFAGFLFDA